MPTKSQWVDKIRKFAAEKNVPLLSGHINELGRYYENNQNADAAFNLLKERSGYKLEGSDYRELRRLLH